MLGKFIRKVSFLVLFLGFLPLACSDGNGTSSNSVPAYSQSQNRGDISELRIVNYSELPSEARHTIALIKKGGPFPYTRDGIVFGNREGRLPQHRRGYYREYTVKTPGIRDRGARRIVTGSEGEFYYTDDHYNTFKLIKE